MFLEFCSVLNKPSYTFTLNYYYLDSGTIYGFQKICYYVSNVIHFKSTLSTYDNKKYKYLLIFFFLRDSTGPVN